MTRTVLFVCPHGAGKSRIAAAFFDHVAPEGWRAISAGQDPADQVSAHALMLLRGTECEEFLDRGAPRALTDVPSPSRIVAIDCEVEGAERWDLEERVIGGGMRDEIRRRAQALAREVSNG
ncbi:MAG: hypothetical protein H0U32_09145 [Thermoleophilaceae bacterium]|nr:hypothetical protein [Thermoleophilaceae bacterium]